MSQRRHLVIVAAESTSFRLTGLSELERLAQTVHLSKDAGTCPWSDATYISPDYGNLKCGGEYAYRIPIPFAAGLTMRIDGDRVKSPLPTESATWKEFADHVSSAVDQTLHRIGDREADILCVDWPTSWAATILAKNPSYRVCFTVDLEPPKEVLSLWWMGINSAKTIQVFTRSWWEHLCRENPQLAQRAGGKVRFLRIGMKSYSAFALTDKPSAKKRIVDFYRDAGLILDEKSMLLIARNRWTSLSGSDVDERKDQKNYALLIEVLPEFMRFVMEQHIPVQVLLGPMPSDATSEWVDFDKKLRAMREAQCGFAVIEPLAEKDRIKWDPLLEGADAQLVPSKFEPGGVIHAQGAHFGVIPICSKAGSMGEPPMSKRNCFRFTWDREQPKLSRSDFLSALRNACTTYLRQPRVWEEMQRAAQSAAREYTYDFLAPMSLALFE
jgi:hypothetical protein